MSYDRKIKYLELIEEEVAVQNAGFVKLEARDGEVTLRIKAEKLKSTDDGAAQVFLMGNGKEALLGELHLEQGEGVMGLEGMKENGLAGSIAYEELQEIRIRLRSDRMLRCVIREKQEEKEVVFGEKELPLMVEAAQEDEAVATKEEQTKEKAIILDSVEEELVHKEEEFWIENADREQDLPAERGIKSDLPKTPAATKWQQLWECYPHITPFDDHREYLKLEPMDLVVLTSECYPLIANSFLLHGFYNYKHLILTKETVRGQEQYYIGAPGNFYTKEKQVAILFGFESFEGKVEPAQNGDFGYYMIPVEI